MQVDSFTPEALVALAEAVCDKPLGRQGPGQSGNTTLGTAAALSDAYFAEVDSNAKATLAAVKALGAGVAPDPAAVASALAGNQPFVQALAAALGPVIVNQLAADVTKAGS